MRTASEMFERSKSSSVMPTYQPRFSSPRTLLAGTRTFSKKVSLKPCSQAMLISGRTLRPGVWMSSISMKLMPRCFGASGSVRTRANSASA